MPPLNARIEVIGYPGGLPAGITFRWTLNQYGVYKVRPAAAWAHPAPLANATGNTVGTAQHWQPKFRTTIGDHDLLFGRLRTHLRDGGALEAQCGGKGNIASVHAAAEEVIATDRFAAHFATWARPWTFATPEETERRLGAAGFAGAQAWLQERPVTPEDPHAYLSEINLGAHLERLPEPLRAPFVDEVVQRLGGSLITIDYVRLNISARA